MVYMIMELYLEELNNLLLLQNLYRCKQFNLISHVFETLFSVLRMGTWIHEDGYRFY